jgi:cold shock CspA family protein
LGARLREIDPDFSHVNYDHSSLRDLLEDFPDVIKLENNESGLTPSCLVNYRTDTNNRVAGGSPRSAKSEARRLTGQVVRCFASGYGFIAPKSRSDDVYVHFSKLGPEFDGFLVEGDIVEYDVVQGNRGLSACNVSFVKWIAPSDRLNAFADMSSSLWLEHLAVLAEQNEPWHNKNSPDSGPFPILRNYIKNTFQRLEEMSDGIAFSKDRKWASFNTGLVTENQEEIYAMFAAIPRPMRQPWDLVGFKKASERIFVEQFGGNAPPLANYFDDPSVLLYDRRCPLIINIDHVMQNLNRFPKHLQSNPYVARQLLTSAEATTRKRVYRNYKAAIPQYFRDKGGPGVVQLLLPICLEHPGKADLALAVQRSGDAYLGSTVLTLDMAYNNARLLARPDTEWLQP